MNAKYWLPWRVFRRGMRALVLIGISALGITALYAQSAGETRFINNTSFVVHIVAGSGRTTVCTIDPHSAGTGRGGFGTAEYFYPVFEVPLTSTFRLRDVRPADSNFFYQVDDRRSRTAVTIDAVPPLNDNASYIVLVNNSRTGGVSIARTASSRLLRIDAGGSDNVNAGERGVFRVNPRDNNDMRIVSPVNIAFSPIVYQPSFSYTFIFDGTDITLIDARPLHAIGLPLNVTLALDDAIPEAERDTIRAALDGALSTNNVPLRVAPEGSGENSEYVRYEFNITLTLGRPTATPTVLPSVSRQFFTGKITIALFRNAVMLADVKTLVTEFDENGVYRALRRFILNEQQFYRRIAEVMNF
jgi:hypothetical protein